MRYIAYYRVSTQKQGRSGLGLEAQQEAVRIFLQGEKPFMEFTDVESGYNNDRPQLQLALKAVTKYNAKFDESASLLIAKLDRLSRNLSFICTLQDNKVPFTCCDMPEMNEFNVHIVAAMAQWQRKYISTTTKDSLQAAKRRGIILGRAATEVCGNRTEPNFTNATRALGPQAIRATSMSNPLHRMAKKAAQLLHTQNKSLAVIAAELNESGYTAARGGNFNAEQVRRLLKTAA